MASSLRIPQEGRFDFMSLGALVHRLDPGIVPFRKATHCDIHVSGGEFNCAANLSDCFGMKTGIATAMVDYPIGDLINERVRAMGVQPFYKHFKHDGVTGPNMATVYSDRGLGVRGPVVFYNRSNEAAGRLKDALPSSGYVQRCMFCHITVPLALRQQADCGPRQGNSRPTGR